MATIKSCTNVEQSRKLAEFLPLESADMCYPYDRHLNKMYGDIPYVIGYKRFNGDTDIPCWSLASLLSVLPMIDFTTPQLVGTPKTLYRCMYNDNLKSPACDNAVDACYEMIIKLNEQNLL